MLETFQKAMRLRVLIVFLTIHLGFGLSIYGVARASMSTGMDSTAGVLLAGAALLYFGFVLGVFFIVWPLLPWIRRVRQVTHWTDRIRQELPLIIDVIRQIVAIWNEARKNGAEAPKAHEPAKPEVS